MKSNHNPIQKSNYQFNEIVWNQVEKDSRFNEVPKFCYITLCIGYPKNPADKSPLPANQELDLLIDDIEKKKFNFILLLSPRDKKPEEEVSPLEAWKTENADLLRRIQKLEKEQNRQIIFHETEWRKTERWEEAKKTFDKYYNDKFKEMLERDVNNPKNKDKGTPEQIREHCTQCAIDFISFSQPKSEKGPLPILVYKGGYSQIMHIVSQNIKYMDYEEVLHVKPSVISVKNEAKETVVKVPQRFMNQVKNQRSNDSIQQPDTLTFVDSIIPAVVSAAKINDLPYLLKLIDVICDEYSEESAPKVEELCRKSIAAMAENKIDVHFIVEVTKKLHTYLKMILSQLPEQNKLLEQNQNVTKVFKERQPLSFSRDYGMFTDQESLRGNARIPIPVGGPVEKEGMEYSM